MSPDRQEERLIELVREYRERECRSLLEKARAQVAEMIRDARQAARPRVHQAVESERARAGERIRRAEAELNTRRRSQAQKAAATLLEEGWGLLRERLQAAWGDPGARREWILAATAEARRRLPPGHRRIRHPEDWTEGDTRALRDAMGPASRGDPGLEADPAVSAGVVIRSGHSVLDFSLGGLLADRRMIESRMLALVEREKSE